MKIFDSLFFQYITRICLLSQFNHEGRIGRLSGDDLRYFSNSIRNDGDFRKHLQNILIPRVPGTRGSQIVREVIKQRRINPSYHAKFLTRE